MPGRTPPLPPQEPPPVRLWRWRRNPLRRRSDLIQAWIGLALLLALPVATFAAVLLARDTAHRHYTRTAQHQAATRHQTTAVLLEDTRRHPEPGSAEARKTLYPAKVRFTDRDGHWHTAKTDVQPALHKGATVRVWADTDGEITGPPLSPDQIRSRAAGWAVIAALMVPAGAAAAYGVAGRIIHRHNLAAWDTAWAEFTATAPGVAE